ncbi:MAG TPA: xylulokinase [Candidatus Sulfotelmatobacter sp.]|nr:xylulokinase [Candidatus Sulfotelmatobacter sp.]
MRYVLAHDVGTTGNKATLYSEEGALMQSAFVPYGTSYPQAGWAEQSPQDWWESLCLSTRKLLHESRVPGRDVACIVFSGQMMGVVAVDAHCRPVRNAIIWADLRSQSEIDRVAERIDPQRVYAVTGHRLSPSYSGGKMLWIKENDPESYSRTSRFVQAKDYLAGHLTGTFATDPSDASGTNLYDLDRAEWSTEMVEAFDIPMEKLPPILPSTGVVGEVQPSVADEVGVPAGTPVVIGGGDGCCAATGAGVIREGIAYNYIGSSSWIAIATPRPILDPEMRTFTWAHLVPGMFSPCGTMQAAGSSYQWARDQLAETERLVAERLRISPYELMNQEVLQSPPGARGLVFLPYLLGERSPRWNPLARGGFVGLTIRHTPADLLRAVLEGITFNLRVILEAFLRQGARIEALRVIGGGARGAEWNAIMADIFGLPVLRLRLLEEATSMGAAVAGGIGVGLWKSFGQVDEMVEVASEARPDAQRHRLYDELYSIFNDIYEALDSASVFERLARVDRE